MGDRIALHLKILVVRHAIELGWRTSRRKGGLSTPEIEVTENFHDPIRVVDKSNHPGQHWGNRALQRVDIRRPGRIFKLRTERIEDGCKLDKAQKVQGQLLVTRPDPAKALDPKNVSSNSYGESVAGDFRPPPAPFFQIKRSRRRIFIR